MAESLRVLRDLPGIADLEARLGRVAAHPSPLWAKEGDTLLPDADELSLRLFGLSEHDTYFEDDVEWAGRDPDEDPEAYDAAFDRWEAQFVILGDEELPWFKRPLVNDPAMRAQWEALGWDVTDGGGKELRCIHFFGRQIIALAKGLRKPTGGRELTEMEAKSVEDRLKAEAARFKPRR